MGKLLEISTKSNLRSNKALRSCLPYKQAVTVGITFTVEDMQKHVMVKELIKKLELDGKKTTVMCYLPHDKVNYEFLFDFFSNKDFSFFGKLTSSKAIDFASTAFDYLFYLDTEPNPLILNLLARSKAKCRMGKFWDEGEPFFEFMLETTSDTKGLIDGIYRYTSILH
ncbi:MAG TPA: hypothetical protein VFW11_02205 [Cyclobacteriaceae bacterium]|nr:hypothetical protein [Cyclobacteriaceae bacterium]